MQERTTLSCGEVYMGQVLPMTASCCALLALMLGLVGVVQELHAGMAAIRRAVARAAAREAAAEGSACSLCMERPQGVVFGCGHQVAAEFVLVAPHGSPRRPQQRPFASGHTQRRCRWPIVFPAGVRRLQSGALPSGLPVLPGTHRHPHQPLQELKPLLRDALHLGKLRVCSHSIAEVDMRR